MKTPAIGERWYVTVRFSVKDVKSGETLSAVNEIVLAEIIGLSSDNHSLVSCYNPLSGTTSLVDINNEHFISKYEPNWFWRMLGYK